MKRSIALTCFIAVTILWMSFSDAQESREAFKKKNLENMELFLSSDSTLTRLYTLSKARQYDSVIGIAKILLQKDTFNRDYMAFLGASYYNKGQKDSAYYYTLNFVKTKKPFTTLQDLLIYSWYPCFYAIHFDTTLHNEMLRFFVTRYKMNGFPRADLGIRLINLYFNDQRIRDNHFFERGFSNDQRESDLSDKKFKALDEQNRKEVMAMYRAHPEYITKPEVGELASNYQGILILHITDSIPLCDTLLPMLKRAMDKGLIPPDTYVGLYTHRFSYDESQRQMYRNLKDSLCKVYGCKNKTIYH